MIKNYKQLVPRYLAANKKTSLSMVISILFSVMLLVSVGMIIGKYNNTRIEMAQELHGKYHASFLGVYEELLDRLKSFGGISKVGTTLNMGELNLERCTLVIKGADSVALDMLNAKPMQGRLPEKENEFVIEQWVYNKLDYKPKLGEKFKLKYIFKDTYDGSVTNMEVELVLTGILQDFQDSKMFEKGKAYVTLDTALSNTNKNHRIYEQYFTLKSNLPVDTTLAKVVQYTNTSSKPKENKFDGYQPNWYYITALKEAQMARYVAVFFNVIVALAVALVIYNVFNISVIQRKKHYGLLRAIGITQKQIKFMLFFEALLFGVSIIPIGIILGIFSTELIVKFIGGSAFKGSILDEINPINILFPVIVSLVAIGAAVYSPAKLASKISPIESMTMEDIKQNKRAYKGYKPGIMDKLFGYTGKMAINNLKRYKKRFAATIVAMGVGIALFIFSTYIINFLNPLSIVDRRTRGDYVLKLSSALPVNYGYSDETVSKVNNIPGIESVNKFKYLQMDYVLDSSFMTSKVIKDIENKKNLNAVGLMYGKYHVVTQVYGCGDEIIQNLRKNASDNKAEVFIVQNLNNENLTTIKDGDEVELGFDTLNNGKFQHIDKKIKVDKVIDSLPIKLDQAAAGYIATFVPGKFFEDNFNSSGYQEIDINVDKNADMNKIENELQNIANNQRYGELVSYNSEMKKWKGYQLQIGTILMSIVVIIAIVGFINIMNTLNMNIIIRKREFGMLRALGMTKKEMRQTLLKEAALYGFFSSFIGISIGYLLMWIVYRFLKQRAETSFIIDFRLILLTFLVTIFVSICSSILPLKKATSSDIVEAIQAVE